MKSAQLCFKAISFEDDGWPKHELGISPWICSGTISWNNAPWSHKSNIMVTYIWLSLATCTTTYSALSSEWVGCCTAWVVCIRAAVKCVHLEEWVSKEMSFNKQSFSSKLCSLVWLCTTSNKRYPTGFLCTLHIYMCIYLLFGLCSLLCTSWCGEQHLWSWHVCRGRASRRALAPGTISPACCPQDMPIPALHFEGEFWSLELSLKMNLLLTSLFCFSNFT